MAVKKKEFLKKYVSTKNNPPGDSAGSFQTRPAISSPGGVFGGDDYKEKIGREKIPWYLSDFRGRPSMAADAGFSSITMSRVNKGRDKKYDPKPMFPDQDVKELSDEDNYISTERQRGKVQMGKDYFKEDRVVESTKYSLVELEKLMLEDEGWRKFIPDEVEDTVTAATRWARDNVDWRDVIPDELEDEAEEVIDAVGGVLDQAREKGQDAVELLSDKIDDLAGGANIENIKDTALEIGRDFLALTAAGIPVIGTPLAATYVLYNMNELDTGYGRTMEAVDKMIIDGSESDILNLQSVAGDLFDDYVDMMQASTYLIPFVGAAKGIIGAAGRMLGKARTFSAASFLGLGGGSVLKSAVQSEILLSSVFKFVVDLAESDIPEGLGIESTKLYDVMLKVPAWLIVIGDILESADDQLQEWKMSGSSGQFRFDPSRLGVTYSDTQAASRRIVAADYRSGLDSFLKEKIEDIKDEFLDGNALKDEVENMFEDKKMKDEEKLLREFIKESIYHTTRTHLDANPKGWAYRVPPTSADEEDSQSLGSGKDIVNIKTDSGYLSYQARPENLEEQALRRIIRRKIKILESKKKI